MNLLTIIIEEIKSTTRRLVLKHILDSFCLYGENSFKLLPSTPFYANGEYNATSLFMDRQKFTLISVYFSDYIESQISTLEIGKRSRLPIKFLSVSLRSSPFAASVSHLLNYPLQTIEYLGPQRNTMIGKNVYIKERFEYLYLGDFSFAGTEIRITQMFSSFHNSVLEHAFVLGSLFKSERFSDFKLHSLYDLSTENEVSDYKLFLKHSL